MIRPIVFALVLAVPLAAAAQPAPEQPGVGGEDDAAYRLYLEGDRLYAQGRYEEAVARFLEAYEKSGRDELLFNLANTYERMGRYAEAAEALERYAASPRAVDVEAVRQRIRSIQERAAEVRIRSEELERLRARPPCPDPITCPVLEPEPEASDRWAYVLLGTGGVGVVAGVVFAFTARAAGSDAEALCAPGGLCPAEAQTELDRERRFALAADLSIGLGLVSLAGGAYWLWRAHRDDDPPERTRVAPVGVPGGVGIGVAGAF
jgi:tetratricopeptide (TPR) repeat protein